MLLLMMSRDRAGIVLTSYDPAQSDMRTRWRRSVSRSTPLHR